MLTFLYQYKLLHNKKVLAKKIVQFLDREMSNLYLNEAPRLRLLKYYSILKEGYNNKFYWKSNVDGFSINEKAIYTISIYLDDILRSSCISDDQLLNTYIALRLEYYSGVKMQ